VGCLLVNVVDPDDSKLAVATHIRSSRYGTTKPKRRGSEDWRWSHDR
jgi:hypothetical protein